MKSQKNDLLIDTSFLTTITISLFYCPEKLFTLMNRKNLGERHDLYVQSDKLLLADVFENFRNMCLKIHELDPAKFLSGPGLTWQAALKKIEVKLDLLTHIDMLFMIEKDIRGVILTGSKILPNLMKVL